MKRVMKLGEKPSHVFNVGCPRNDLLKKDFKKIILKKEFDYLSRKGVGDLDISHKRIIIL